MGGLEVIQMKELKDVFVKCGGHFVAAVECMKDVKKYGKQNLFYVKYHLKQANAYKALAIELKQFMTGNDITLKQFKHFVYRHFKDAVLHDLTDVVAEAYASKPAHRHALAKKLKNWFVDDKYIEKLSAIIKQ